MKPEYSAEIKNMFLNGIKKIQNKYGNFDKISTLREFKLISSKSQNSISFFF